MNFIKSFESFKLEQPKTMSELLEKLSVVEQSILDSIGAEIVNIDFFLNDEIPTDSLENLENNPSFIKLLKIKGLKKEEIKFTSDYETFLINPFKYLLLRSNDKNNLQNPDYIFIQTFNSTQQKWNSIKLYEITGDFKNFYEKLTNRTIEINHNGSTYLYQTSNKNEFELVNQEENKKFPRFVRKEDLIKMMDIKESKNTGNYYHFVDLDILDYLIENNFIFNLTHNDDKFGIFPYSLSLTRKHDFIWTNFRITFDSKKLTTRYKIKPYHYFNNIVKDDYVEGSNLVNDYRHPYGKGGNYYGNKPYLDNQYEERLYSKKQFLALKDYIIQIDILDFDRDIMNNKIEYNMEDIKNKMKTIEKVHDIKVNLVPAFNIIK